MLDTTPPSYGASPAPPAPWSELPQSAGARGVDLASSRRARELAWVQHVHLTGDLPGGGEGTNPATLPAADLRLVLGHSSKVLQIQDTDEDCLQNRGRDIMKTFTLVI